MPAADIFSENAGHGKSDDIVETKGFSLCTTKD